MENDIRSAIEGIRSGEPGDRVTARLKTELDKVMDSPEVRAIKILELIRPALDANKVSAYDVICFAAGYLGAFSSEYTFLKDVIIEAQKLIHVYHYLYRDGD